MDNTDLVLTLPDSPFPLAQCTGLKVGKLFSFARFDEVNACLEWGDTFDRVHNLIETPFEVSCDVYVHEDSSSLGFNYVILNPLDHFHVIMMCSQPSSFLEYSFNLPIDNSMLCDSHVYLGHEDNILKMLGGEVANFLFLGYLSGYDASLTRIAYT